MSHKTAYMLNKNIVSSCQPAAVIAAVTDVFL